MASQTTQPPSNSTNSSTPAFFFRTYTYYQRLPQGRAEKVAIAIHLAHSAVSHRARGEEIKPMRFEVTGSEDLTSSNAVYPASHKRYFPTRREPVDVIGPDFVFQLNLKAAKNTPLGDHVVRGKLSFQLIGDDGGLTEQQLDVALPVTIVPAGESVARSEWPFSTPTAADNSKRDKAVLWALAPLLIPLSILMGIFCFVTGQDCRC